MTALFSVDQARALLAEVFYRRADVRDGETSESYGEVLQRAFSLVGVSPSKAIPERTAGLILKRSHKAATEVGVTVNPLPSARAAAQVLEQAARMGR